MVLVLIVMQQYCLYFLESSRCSRQYIHRSLKYFSVDKNGGLTNLLIPNLAQHAAKLKVSQY